jgi:hypothetical protein
VSGTCPDCGSELDAVQRYCITCGRRINGEAPSPATAAAAPAGQAPRGRTSELLGRLPRLPLPSPREAAVFVVAALIVGIIAGKAIDTDRIAVAAGDVLGQASTGDSSDDASGGDAGPTLAAPSGNVEPPAADLSSDFGNTEPDVVEPTATPSEAPAEEPAADEPDPPADHPDDDEPPPGKEVNGTVVHLNPAAGSYALAITSGDLRAVHVERLPDLGASGTVRIEELRNGTFRQHSFESVGTDAAATFGGTVTFVSAEDRNYVVSAPGVSLAVHSPDDHVLPPVRALVSASVALEQTDARVPAGWTEESLEIKGAATGPIALAGSIQGIDAAARTIDLSADDTRHTGHDITLALPPMADLALLRPGQMIAATAEIGDDGIYRLVSAYADGGLEAAQARPLFK